MPIQRSAACTLALLGFVVAATATTAVAESTKIDPSWPDWLKERMAKEHDEMRFEPLSIGPVNTVMPGEIKERQETGPGRFYASAADGSGTDIECWFFSDALDLATSTANIANVVVESMSKQHGPVAFRSVHHVDAGEIDGSSFLALEWLYTVGEAPDALVGLAKVRAAQRDGMSVICAHNLPGYRNSFAEGFAELVRQLESGSKRVDPYLVEVHVFSLNNLRTGFSKVTMTLGEDGNTRINATEAMLIPISSTELATSDSTAVSWSTPDGHLINAVDASGVNGEVTMKLSLGPDDEGVWVVDGTFSGKALSEELGIDVKPVSVLGEMLATRKLMQESDMTSVDLASWLPDADPTVLTTVTVALDPESDVPGAATITMGPLKVNGELDDDGSLRRGTMDVGGASIVIERVFRTGGLR